MRYSKKVLNKQFTKVYYIEFPIRTSASKDSFARASLLAPCTTSFQLPVPRAPAQRQTAPDPTAAVVAFTVRATPLGPSAGGPGLHSGGNTIALTVRASSPRPLQRVAPSPPLGDPGPLGGSRFNILSQIDQQDMQK